jgi:hypothetical protein
MSREYVDDRGTQAFIFTPTMLVSQAKRDIDRHERNALAELGNYETLGFHPGDLRGSVKPSEVLRKALKRIERQRKKPKGKRPKRKVHKDGIARFTPVQRNRALLYSDAQLLEVALGLALQEERDVTAHAN